MNANYAADMNAYAFNLFEDVMSNSDTTELDAQEELLGIKDDVSELVRTQVGKVFSMTLGIEDTTLALVRSALDLYFSTGDSRVLDLYRNTIRELAGSFKNAGHRTTILSQFNLAVLNGCGRLVATPHVNKNGEALYDSDDAMCCVVLERGKFNTKSNNRFKAVRTRYHNELRGLNLIAPRMYKTFAKRNEKRNMLQLIEDLDSMASKYDDTARKFLEQLATNLKLQSLERARNMQDRAQSA